MERLAALVNGDRALVRRGRTVNDDVLIEIGDMSFHVSIRNGEIAAVQRGPQLMRSWSFAVRGGAEAWRAFWQAEPPPQRHDIFALTKRGDFRIEGNLKMLMTNLLYYKGVLAAPRRLAAGAR